MKGNSEKIVEKLEQGHVCPKNMMEGNLSWIAYKGHTYKSFQIGNNDNLGGILLAEKWVDMVIGIVRIYDRIIKLRTTLSGVTVSIIFAYAPHTRLADTQKDCLNILTSKTKDDNILILAGDFIGHVVKLPDVWRLWLWLQK